MKLFGICGPTASGKTSLAIEICERLKGEVISADSMQLYSGMDILSAKPSDEELHRVPHHLIAIADPATKFNASEFRKYADAAIRDVEARHKLPLLCGGTGLYIDALTKGIRMSEAADEGLREQLKKIANEVNGPEKLHAMLASKDPEAAKKYPAADTRRVIRSIEMFELTGKTRLEQEAEDALIPDRYDARLFALDWDRQELYKRCDMRVDEMLRMGLIDEVKALMTRPQEVQETAAQAIGYKEMVRALTGDISISQAIEDIKLATRHLAKRQLTWFRRDKRVIWLKPSASNVQIICDYIRKENDDDIK